MTRQEKVAYWTQRVKDQAVSGLSVKRYCAQEEIPVGTLQYWRPPRIWWTGSTPKGASHDRKEVSV
ncbi:IS66 family insertion sequence element accessory protein TnpA [Acidithiobacillus caldus]|uniref:IS66 family insertion sequence element accessory protein TnpA n=1 Tax=Acidithiobacillus caldus TaxID=33059 RepID=UPI0039893F26